jgi:hypothetical protein
LENETASRFPKNTPIIERIRIAAFIKFLLESDYLGARLRCPSAIDSERPLIFVDKGGKNEKR